MHHLGKVVPGRLDTTTTFSFFSTDQGLFRFRIVLPDRKNNAKDMAFCPTESFHTAAQGREHAALLALLKLQEDQPLERKLPEPYK